MMILKLAWLNLFRNLRRTVVLMITVAMGVGALFIFDGFNSGIMNQYKENTIRFKTGHGQLNTKGYRDQVFEKPWEHWIENPEALIGELRTLPHVTHVFPRVDLYGVLTNGSVSVAGRGTGIVGSQEADFFTTMNIVEGETLKDQKDGILIGVGLARALKLKPGDRLTLLTNTIQGSLNGADFKVVGIFHSGHKDADDSYFRIQLPVALSLLDTTHIEAIAIGLSDDQAWPGFANEVQKRFPQLEATAFAVLDKVYYQHAVDWLGQQFFVIQIVITLLITLGIMNTMSFTIVERTAEIGNLRANGDSSTEVMMILLCEAGLVGILGSMIGLFLAWSVTTFLIPNGIVMPPAPGITRQFAVKIELQSSMMFFSSLLGLATCLIACFLAAWRRVRLPIGQCLRYR